MVAVMRTASLLGDFFCAEASNGSEGFLFAVTRRIIVAGYIQIEPGDFHGMVHDINLVFCKRSDKSQILRVPRVIIMFQIREIRILYSDLNTPMILVSNPSPGTKILRHNVCPVGEPICPL